MVEQNYKISVLTYEDAILTLFHLKLRHDEMLQPETRRKKCFNKLMDAFIYLVLGIFCCFYKVLIFDILYYTTKRLSQMIILYCKIINKIQ